MLLILISKTTLGFPGGSGGKESDCNARDLGSIPGLGRFPGEGNGNPLQHSLAWRTPWTEESSRLQSMESQRVKHNCEINFQLFFFKTTLFTIGLTLWPGDQIYVRKSIIESQFPCLLAVWSWANYLTSLNITFSLKKGLWTILATSASGDIEVNQMDDISKELHKL